MPRLPLYLLLVFLAPMALAAQDEPVVESGQAHLSPRNASYVIEVTLDPETKMLQGKF